MMRMPLGSGLFGMDGPDPNQLPLIQSLMGGTTPTLRPPRMPLGSGMYDMPMDQPGNMPLGSGMYGQTVEPNIQPGQPAPAQPTPPSGGTPSTTSFGEGFQNLMNNPMFQFGLSLLGSSNQPNPWGPALQNTLAAQLQNAQAKHLQAQSDAEARRTAVAEKESQAHIPLVQAQTVNTAAEGRLHDTQGQIAQRNQAMTEGILSGMGMLPSNMGAPGAQGISVPQVGDAQGAPAGGQGMQPTGGTGLFNLPPGVDPRAFALHLASGDLKGAGGLIQDATKPIVSNNGMVYMRTPDGGVSIAPGSLAAMAQVYGLENGIKGQYGQVEIPMSNGQKMTLSPTEWQAYQSSGQLPQRYSSAVPAQAAPAQAAPAQAAPTNPMAAPANWQAINNNPASVGGPTPTLTKGGNAGSDRVQILQDELAKETDPGNRAAISREIKLAGGTPVVGMTQDPAQTPDMQIKRGELAVAQQNADNNAKRTNADVAKTGQEMQGKEAEKAQAQADAKLAYQNYIGNLDRMSETADKLLKHPGLADNVGIGGALKLYNVTPNGRDAAALLDSLKGKMVIDTMGQLKALSKTGSTGFGSLSEPENQRLEGYIANLTHAQSKDQITTALKDLQNFASESKKNFTERYNSLYGNNALPSVSNSIDATPQDGGAMSLDDYLAKHSGKRK